MFKDIRAEAEGEIEGKLISKMDEFVELANYDWLMPEALGTSSPWLMDLIAFLRSVFLSFTNLPTKLAQMSCMSACQHLARSLLDMVLDVDNVKAMSLGVIHQIDLDVVQCELFAASEPVPGLQVIRFGFYSKSNGFSKSLWKETKRSLNRVGGILHNRLGYTVHTMTGRRQRYTATQYTTVCTFKGREAQIV